MRTFKTLGVLAGIAVALAVSATPTYAWWESSHTQGPVTFVTTGLIKIGVAEVACFAPEVQAQWHIQTKGQIKQQQAQATQGPHLNIQVKDWGKCFTKISGGTLIETTIKPCDLQLVQQKGSFNATFGVATSCLVKVSILCEFQIPAGMEKQPGSNEGINVGLKNTALTEIVKGAEKSQLDKTTIRAAGGGGQGQLEGEGVFVVQIPGHALCPVATNEKTEIEAFELEASGGIKLI